MDTECVLDRTRTVGRGHAVESTIRKLNIDELRFRKPVRSLAP